MPYEPPKPPPLPQLPRPSAAITSSQYGSPPQWLGRPNQGGATLGTFAPLAGPLQAPAQPQNGPGYSRTPSASAPVHVYSHAIAQHAVNSNISPLPPNHGQSTARPSASLPTSNGHAPHSSYTPQPPQKVQARRISQTPIIPPIPPIPRPAQSRPAQPSSSSQPQPPRQSRIPPPIYAVNGNGVTTGAATRGFTSQILKVRTRPSTTPSIASTTDANELVNMDDDDTPPLIVSDLDPRFGKPSVKSSTTPSQSQAAFVPIVPAFSPRGSGGKAKDSNVLSGMPTLRPPMPQPKPQPEPPVDAVDQRIISIPNRPVAKTTTTVTAMAAAAATVDRQTKGGKGGRARLQPVGDARPRVVKRPVGRPRLPRTTAAVAKDMSFYGKQVQPGRRPVPSMESVQRTIFRDSSVPFVPFKCEWAGCRAELHNLATLARHLDFVHGRGGRVVSKKTSKAGTAAGAKAGKQTEAGTLTCQWRRCAAREPPVQFGSHTAFMEHINYWHLQPLSWHRGDGFANSSHLGPPPTPTAIVLAGKEADRRRLGQQTGRRDELDGAAEQYDSCATTARADMAIRVPVQDVPGYLMDNGRQVTPILRDPILSVSSAFWSAEEWGRRIKGAYRQQNKRPERRWME